jgi:hypothetical protein
MKSFVKPAERSGWKWLDSRKAVDSMRKNLTASRARIAMTRVLGWALVVAVASIGIES